MMSTKAFIIVSAVILTCILAGVSLYLLYMPHRNIQREAPVIISTAELIHAYEKDEPLANTRFLDKVLQVDGVVSNLETNNEGKTVVTLAGESPLSGVRCTLRENQPVEVGQSITLKGRCTGYLTDVVVIECIILNRK